MWGTSPLCSSLRDNLSAMKCRGLEKQIHSDMFHYSSCTASCSIVPGEALVKSSLSKGKLTNGRPRSRGTRAKQQSAWVGHVSAAAQNTSRLEAVGGEESRVRLGDGEEVGDPTLQGWAALDVPEANQISERNGSEVLDAVDVTVEKTGSNMRKIIAKISVRASLEEVWAILTDYERLADFIPGLAVSELLERRDSGCRLYQVGEQDIALGVKFKAKAVVDCEERPCEVEPTLVRRDIRFNTVEGDFQVFKGTWRMEQVSGPSTFLPGAVGGVQELKTHLYYILDVQPKLWLPVALVEGRLTREISLNLVCIRDRVHKGPAA